MARAWHVARLLSSRAQYLVHSGARLIPDGVVSVVLARAEALLIRSSSAGHRDDSSS